MAASVIPVIISGGAGSRLWPLSTPERPKQFHVLGGDRTLIQQAALRLSGADGLSVAPPVVICNQSHLQAVKAQMAEIGCAPAAIVLEPFGRNTAAVAMTAALLAAAADPEALVLLMPSDQLMPDPNAFNRSVAAAAPSARERIVLLGVTPTAPETGFGYIEAGEPISPSVSAVKRFVEKPDVATAEAYLASGRYLWNAGMFLASPAVMLAELRRHAPEVAAAAEAALNKAEQRDGAIWLDAEAFAACPSVSLDYAVMEKTDKAAVAPLSAGWADIGAWSSLWAESARDVDGNAAFGPVELLDAHDCLVWSEDRTVAVIGLDNIVVVNTAEGVLVLPKSRSQDVKVLVERMAAKKAAAGA
ncbi:MAG TPA: mannose-1-phosphate guanylyltransferase/mannose-6-phosphate isomerase [Caulobacteraceae bacterium]|nr:mannose-1-phosphate guanylyltransferase/mannose-6-phosphate isomerase [Caulobacteraceae bacterium]